MNSHYKHLREGQSKSIKDRVRSELLQKTEQLEPWRRQWRRQHVSPPPPSDCRQKKPKIVELSDEALSTVMVKDGYRLGSTVGHGSYSKVRMALKSLSDNSVARVACKVIDKRRESGGSYVRKFLPRELEVLCAVRHPNIVRTHRIYVTPSTVHVFMDYCEVGDLLNHLQHTKSIPLWQAQTFFK